MRSPSCVRPQRETAEVNSAEPADVGVADFFKS